MGHHRLATPDLGRIFRGEAVAGFSEWQLLERYLECRDGVAFEALVARHGPMVLGVCRRMLGDRMDVEDAFQATFLVLVRRASHLGPRDAIGPWLYGVATRVAMRARSEAARRRRFQPLTSEVAAVVDDRSTANREIGEILDQELSRLPSKYRHPMVLCYLEGQTHEEAARQLKWPIGTVKGRLARARDLLQSRLVRLGLTPAVGALSLALSPDSSAALHRELLERTVKSSLKLACGQATAQIVSTSITSLVEGVLTSMFFNTLKWAGTAVLVGGLAFVSVGVMARQDATTTNAEAPPPTKAAADNAEPKYRAALIAHDDVKAPIADAKHKLADLHNVLRKAALMEWEAAYNDCVHTNADVDGAYQASKRVMEAEQEFPSTPDVKAAAVEGHLQRIRRLARAQHGKTSLSGSASAQVRAYAAESELWLAQAKTNRPEKAEHASPGGGITEGHGKDPKSQQIFAKLDEPVSMSFSDDTPLEDVLKYVKQATTTKTFAGIPIYVDPMGLQEAEKSMTSTVRNMDLDGVPLRRTLQMLLKQLDLIYFVDDGVLCITAESSNGTFGPAIREPAPILQRVEKAERGEMSLDEMKELIEVFKTKEQIKRLSAGGNPEPKPDDHTFGDNSSTKRGATRALVEPKQDATGQKKETDESKQDREQMNALLKEMRELIEVLKAEKQTKKADQGK